MQKSTAIVALIFPLVSQLAIAQENGRWSSDLSGSYTTTDLKKDAPSIYTYVPTYYGYQPVLSGTGGAVDGNIDSGSVNATMAYTAREHDGSVTKARIGVGNYYTNARTLDGAGTISEYDEFKAASSIEVGMDTTFTSQESKSSTTIGLGYSHDTIAKADRFNISAGYSKQYDAITIDIRGTASRDPNVPLYGQDKPTDYAGTILSLTPTVAFQANDSDQLYAGVNMITRYSDVKDGKKLDIRRSDNQLILGASRRLDKKNVLHADVKTGSSSSLGSTVSLGWSHDF